MSQNKDLCTVYNQYLDTNTERFIDGVCRVFRGYGDAGADLLQQYFDINKAKGAQLDNFGIVLNFNRYITFNDPLDVVLPTSYGIDEYLRLMNDLKQCRLTDDAYRTILKIILQTRNTVSSVTTLSKIISDTLGADVFVGDHLDMRYITYYFLDRIPAFLEVCIHNYDILPRPAGMATRYISAISRFLGFLIDSPAVNIEATKKLISSFWKCRFPEADAGPIRREHDTLAPIIPYTLINITQDDLQAAREALKQAQFAALQSHTKLADREFFIASMHSQDRNTVERVKETIGASFTPYTNAISYSDRLAPSSMPYFMYEAYLGTLEALDKREKIEKNLYLKRQISKYKDPRTDLYFDKSTGWYFYREPDSTGAFMPEAIANLYQDSCGLWYPQEPLHEQALRGQVILRQDNYGSSGITKVLPGSPFVDKYRNLFSKESLSSILHEMGYDDIEAEIRQARRALQQAQQSLFIAEEDDDKRSKQEEVDTIRDRIQYLQSQLSVTEALKFLNKIIDPVHDACRIYQKYYKLHKSSFRAIIDFEYRNGDLVMYRNYMRDRGYGNTDETRGEQGYWKYIYDKLNAYYGRNRSYDDTWNDVDTNALVYKRKIFLKTQRYHVREGVKQLQNKYDVVRNAVDGLSSRVTQKSLMQELYKAIEILKNDVATPYWLPEETADDWYSLVRRTNRELDPDITWNDAEEARQRGLKEAYNQAGAACYALSRYCNEHNGSTRGQGYNSWYCQLKGGLHSKPDFNKDRSTASDDPDMSAKDDSNTYCGTKNWLGNYGEPASDKASIQYARASEAEKKEKEHKQKAATARRQKAIRSHITQYRNLQTIVDAYEHYTPRFVTEPDEDEVNKVYPDWTLPDDIF